MFWESSFFGGITKCFGHDSKSEIQKWKAIFGLIQKVFESRKWNWIGPQVPTLCTLQILPHFKNVSCILKHETKTMRSISSERAVWYLILIHAPNWKLEFQDFGGFLRKASKWLWNKWGLFSYKQESLNLKTVWLNMIGITPWYQCMTVYTIYRFFTFTAINGEEVELRLLNCSLCQHKYFALLFQYLYPFIAYISFKCF